MLLLAHAKYRITLLLILFVLINVLTDTLEYTVTSSDTLYRLSHTYNVPVQWILRVNHLKNEIIHPGQSLKIPVEGILSLEIIPGDTLSALALEFGISEDYLRRYNTLENDHLKIGQILRLPPPVALGKYQVIPGDTLLDIAIRQNINIEQLRTYNNLENDVIYPNQQLVVKPPTRHKVKEGESLWSISQKYGIDMNTLKSWNNLQGDVIHPDELLVFFPDIIHPDIPRESRTSLATLPMQQPKVPPLAEDVSLPHSGEYFFSFPKAPNQPNNSYWEPPDALVTEDYRRAKRVLALFKQEIASLPQLDNRLAGWHVVIDPGHGGLDPGAIVTATDGNGNPVVIIEDEYAYDVSVRLYRALRRHGASVSLTVIAPDHHIRNGIDARQTFTHRKNEVYNKASQNAVNGWRPVGITEGLDMRKTIATEQIARLPLSKKKNGTLYVSIHADNTSNLSEGTAVLYDGSDTNEKNHSRSFASALIPYLGMNAFIHSQPVRILEDNPADAAVLVEIRNIHYSRNAWALRSPELREQDALKLANGIMAWATQ